jgi:hypothetical protein
MPEWSPHDNPYGNLLTSSFAPPPIQAKLTVGAVGDKYEQEADSVAAQVVKTINQPQGSVQPKSADEGESLQMQPQETLQREEMPEEEELQMKPESIQREEMPEEEELQMKPTLQRVGKEGGAVSDEFNTQLQGAKGGGQALDPGLQTQMGQAMGADFSGIKVHADSQSNQLNESIQSKAFTTGADVFFRAGEYNPGSKGGQELIAHELTHVMQQGQGAAAVQRLSAEDITTDAKKANSSFNQFKTSSLMPVIDAVKSYKDAPTPEKLDAIKTAVDALDDKKQTKYATALSNLDAAMDAEEQRLKALRVTTEGEAKPEGQTARVQALRQWIDKAAGFIKGGNFQAAYAHLANYQGLAKPTAIGSINIKHIPSSNEVTAEDAIEAAQGNMAFSEEDRILICFPSNWKWINDPDKKAVQAGLLMHLEEYMHIYQARSGEYMSSRTGMFKESDMASDDPAEADAEKAIALSDFDYDETDVMAQMEAWGFDPEEIRYADRYEGREEYMEWRKATTEESETE